MTPLLSAAVALAGVAVLGTAGENGGGVAPVLTRYVFGRSGLDQTSGSAAVRVQGTIGQSIVGARANESVAISTGFWNEGESVIGVDDAAPTLGMTRLLPASPNPFNPKTTIRFELADREHVSVRVYDVKGRHVATVLEDVRAPGRHAVPFQPRDLASGVYFYELRAGAVREVRRITLLK